MLKNKPFYKRKNYWGIVASIIVLIAIVVGLNFQIVQKADRVKMKSEGQLRLSNIASQVENSVSQAECYAESYGAQLELMLSSGEVTDDDIYAFIHSQNEILSEKTDGACSASYVAYNKKLYMEDFVPDEDFTLTERVWYVGAEKNAGKTFVTDPYVDANTGDYCYSISLMLDDGMTIVGMDFTMQDIQDYIEEMNSEIDDGISMIINSNGTVVGHSNSDYIGQSYQVLDYSELIDKVFKLYGNYFEYTTSRGKTYTVFSDKISSDWYTVVCIPSDSIKSNSNINSFLVDAMLIVIGIGFIFIYTLNFRRRIKDDEKLRIQKNLVNNISKDLRKTVNTIINQADLADELSSINGHEFIGQIRDSSRDLLTDLENITTYKEFSEKHQDKVSEKVEKNVVDSRNHRKQGFGIAVVLLVAAIISIAINTYTQINFVKARMQKESDEYFSQLQSWVDTNITLTNDLALHMGAQPELYKDYEGAVKYLDDVVGDNSDISVAYIVNPKWEHTVIMNNGWEPTDPSWHVEERDWYVDTILSNDGFNISTPYKDEQTGMYCVTFSQIVYDENGEIVGLIGIDFYMDTLIDILGESYSDTGYAFLTDPSYNILNHPYKEYQMSSEKTVNAASTEYRKALVSGKITQVNDYDGDKKVVLCQSETKSGFTVITVKDFWTIYSTLVVSDSMLFVVFAICIGLVFVIIRYMTKWQERLNRELKIAADEAIAAGNAKTDFLANMSHEIRTPINAVLGMNEMVLREAKDPVIRDYSLDIQSAGKNLLSIINDILDFSKIESGKMTIVPAEYELSSIINDLVNMISNRAKSKELEFNLEIDEKLPAVLYGDDVRICQIITNVLTNAVKYTDKGSVTMIMRRENMDKEPVDGENVKIYVSVQDTGRGIKQEDMDKLYSSFTRIDEKNTRNIEGTGLGINITSSLLNMMGSELKVESVFGQGSNFYFVLEQKVIKADAIGNYKERYKKSLQNDDGEKTKLVAPKAKVLIVDDTEMNLKVEANLLKRTEAQIEVATNGPMALEMLSKNKYDIIFLDHMMPGMDGIETLSNAKEKDIIGDTPVIALTANAVAGAREKYLEAGFNDYLSKPVKGKDIEKMVFKYINKDLVEEKKE